MKPKVEPWVQKLVRADIEAAIANKDVGSLRNFASEAQASGMPEDAERALEVASLLESWAAKSARAELLKIKAAFEPQPPTQAELVRRFDEMVFDAAPPFDRTTSEDLEHRRVEEQNRQLAAKQQRLEEQRAPVSETATPTPWWRR